MWDALFIVEKFVAGSLVETEANERAGRYFTTDEATRYASAAGFEEARATGGFTEDPPSSDCREINVRCRKPAQTIR